MEGVSFSVEDFHAAIEKYDFNSEIGTKVSAFFLFGLTLGKLLKVSDFLCRVLADDEKIDTLHCLMI